MYSFTSEELYVLAAVLGREFLIGVENQTYESNLSGLKELYKSKFSSLEAGGVFEYRLDGTIIIDRDLRRIIGILNKAERVILISTDLKGKEEHVQYYNYADMYCKMALENYKYHPEITGKFSRESILEEYGVDLSVGPSGSARLSMSSLRRAYELYKSFESIEADNILQQSVPDDEVRLLIRDCLMTNNGFFVFKEYRKTGNRLIISDELIIRTIKDRLLVYEADDQNNVIVNNYRKENC